MTAKVVAIEGSTTGSIMSVSVGSMHDMNTDVIAEIPCTPTAPRTSDARKRKRHSFTDSPNAISDDVRAEIDRLLSYVPKVAKTFNIINKIGEGTFSSVYMAEVNSCGPDVKQKFALKHIIPTSHPERIMGELQCLHKIGGIENVMGMKLSLRERDHVVIVMPYFPHDSFHVFVRKMSVAEMREYMRNLLLALRRVHRFDVIHRDIKPSNFLCNRALQKYALVDFGLAQKVPSSDKSSTVPSHLQSKTLPSSMRRPHRTLPVLPKPVSSVNERKTEAKHPPSDSISRLAELDPNTFINRTEPHKPKGQPLAKTFQMPKTFNQKTAVANKSNTNAKTIQQSRAGAVRLGSDRRTSAATAKTCGCFGRLQVCGVCTSRSGQAAPRAGTPGFRSPEVLLKCPDQTTAVDMWAAGVILLSVLSGRYPFFKAEDDMTALAQIMSIVGTEEMKQAAREYGKEITCDVKLPAMDLKKMCIQLRKSATSSSPRPSAKRCKLSSPPSKEQQPTQRKTRRQSLENQPRASPDVTTPNTSPKGSLQGKRKPSSRSPPSAAARATGKDRIPDSAYDLLSRLLDLNPKMRISAEEALKHPFIVAC